MRKLTIKREKALLNLSGPSNVYIQDNESDDLKLEYFIEEGRRDFGSFRKIGKLENGEEATFEIGNDAVGLIVLSDEKNPELSHDFHQISAGEDDVFLSGRIIGLGRRENRFLFNKGGEDRETVIKREKKRQNRTTALLIISFIIIGFLLGYALSSAIFGIFDAREQAFTVGEMSITLNGDFDKITSNRYTAVLLSDDVTIFVSKDNLDATGKYLSIDNYAALMLLKSGFTGEILHEDDLCYFVCDRNEEDGSTSRFYAYTYKTDDAFWFVQFMIDKRDAKKYADDIVEWAKSVSFE